VPIDVRPPLPDDARAAVERALADAGEAVEDQPSAYRSAWRRAAALEAVDGVPDEDGYALSPRSTRGATRA
jgi:hypothetical protein